MSRELAPLLRGIRPQKADGTEFFELSDAVIAVGGVGEKAARHTAESLVSNYSPSTLISAGLVGALTPKLRVGDVVEVKQVVDAASGVKFETGLRQTVRWYLDQEDWWRDVTSGAYKAWIDKNYGSPIAV
jgi:nucleoside phosphorylase